MLPFRWDLSGTSACPDIASCRSERVDVDGHERSHARQLGSVEPGTGSTDSRGAKRRSDMGLVCSAVKRRLVSHCDC